VDVSSDWKPVECVEEQSDMRELWMVENQAGCSVMLLYLSAFERIVWL
jgi:hypothetical protein